MHIYAFGSICRGEVEIGSDVDLLAAVDEVHDRFSRSTFSVYSYKHLKRMWTDGHPFAWHLALESRLIFSEDQRNFITDLGAPSTYAGWTTDCDKFRTLFREASRTLRERQDTVVFELSTIFLAIRNLAICFSLERHATPTFSRHAALRIGEDSLQIDPSIYRTFESARILCARGHGERVSDADVEKAAASLDLIQKWMDQLAKKATAHV